MNLCIQVSNYGKIFSLEKALELGYIYIHGNQIESTEGTILSISSRLYDCNGNELFENDIVQTLEGKQYKIIYDIGMFYLLDLKTKAITPMYIYKLGNRIDVEKV